MLNSVSCDVECWNMPFNMLKAVEHCWTKIELGSIPFNMLPSVATRWTTSTNRFFLVSFHVALWKDPTWRAADLALFEALWQAFLLVAIVLRVFIFWPFRVQIFLFSFFFFYTTPTLVAQSNNNISSSAIFKIQSCCSTKAEWVFNKSQPRSTFVAQ